MPDQRPVPDAAGDDNASHSENDNDNGNDNGNDNENGHDNGRTLFGPLTKGGERNFLDTLRAENVGALLLLVASVIALIWASSPWASTYQEISDTRVGPARLGLDLTIATWATDGLLAFFFFVVGLELKREFVVGELSSPRRAALPVIAALGGMAAPAAIYLLVNTVADGEPGGWAVPTATDIAFAVAVISAFGRRLPTSLRAFLLTLAVADDFGGIIIIAAVFAHGFNVLWLLAGLACIAAFGWLVRRRASPALLFILGALAWWAVHSSGIHATITGAALAFTVPAVPRDDESESAAERYEHVWRPFTAAFAVPVFAFFAVGMPVDAGILRDAFGSPIALGIILGLVLGKPIGIVSATLLGARLLRLHPDARGAWSDLLAVSCTAGIGFTVSLLINELTFDGRSEEVGKSGVLIASLLSAALAAVLLAWRSRVHERRGEALPPS
ncbi:MAG TPA: Na+/H+ antiporter NhaA [Intrasporangium sp.]|uniref:Na+/H+ antiporter NhaA n=1 Tax=Intrasporangium sp. TaxID=1925024 RepID=UPI002B47E4FD|nr:Na+/H+ antiporter NhaA [Intrasporangium sp.]HKX68034.1 Na+/H+ antiporter NhaA [Intrasporangium sp.]